MNNQPLTIYTDGAARGNPGPAAGAFTARVGDSEIFSDALYLGDQTNNTAEYQAVLHALQWVKNKLDPKVLDSNPNVQFFLDSQLVQRQLIGQYKVKQPHLQQLYQQIKTILTALQSRGVTTTFTHIPRSQNNLADGLANQCLDANS